MDARCEKMLKEIMAAEFTVIDLNLYLDTHPCDVRTINLYNSNVQRLRTLKEKYEKACGPLTANDSYNNGCTWRWIESPWPWEGQ